MTNQVGSAMGKFVLANQEDQVAETRESQEAATSEAGSN